MYTYYLADTNGNTLLTANCIRVTNVKIDVEKRYPNLSWLNKSLYRIKSSFSISPEKMAESYTYLATSPEVSKTSGEYFDDPQHRVKSNSYSMDKENIRQLMQLTYRYFQK